MNPFPRTTPRMEAMVARHLKSGEQVKAALPVWIAGTYRAFVGSIGLSAGFGAALAVLTGADLLIMTALAAAGGALVGRSLAMRRIAEHPLDARALQVFVGVTNWRLLIHEPGTWGKGARLLAEYPLHLVTVADYTKGSMLRLSRLTLGVAGVVHEYEIAGLWDIDELLQDLG